jgi:hypothetical protein
MSELFELVVRVLKASNQDYTVLDGREVAVLHFNSGRMGVTQSCFADARTDLPMLLCYATVNEPVPPARQAAINAYLQMLPSVAGGDDAPLIASREYHAYPAIPPLADPFTGFESEPGA